MAERVQPSRGARVPSSLTPSERVDGEDEVDDIQQRLRDLLGSDEDDDMDYTPHLVECELSDDDYKDKKKQKKKAVGKLDLLNTTAGEASVLGDTKTKNESTVRDEDATLVLDDTKPIDEGRQENEDDLSDDSIVFNKLPPRKKIRPKKKSFNRRKPLGERGEVYVRDIKYMPTELKKSTDRILPARKMTINEARKQQAMQELLRMVPQDDPEAACNFVVELMQRPQSFWERWDIPDGSSNHWNFQVEEVGLICVQILERLICSKKLLLEMILKVGKISADWRFKSGSRDAKGFEFIPKTMTRCAQILLEEGDVKGFEELFQDFRNNLRNVKGEKMLVLYRCVSAMLDKKKFDEGSDVISLGGASLGTSFTNKSAGPHPDSVISEVKTAIKDKAEVDWLMPLFSWYVMDEKSADDVKDMLTEYRNDNLDHLPAHQHLLEFLFQEYEDETEILIEELKIFSEQFPWDESVLTYCKLLVKKGEDDDLDDSFESNEENERSRSEEKLENRMEVFEIAVKFLDYEMNEDNSQSWDLIAESLKLSLSSHKEASFLSATNFLSASFGDRGGWWVDQNFKNLENCDTNVLMKKGLVAACLYGQKNEKYLQVLSILEQRNQAFPSSSLTNLLKELQVSVQSVTSPCLEPFQPDFSGVDRNWNKREWNKIDQIRKYVNDKKNKKYFAQNKNYYE